MVVQSLVYLTVLIHSYEIVSIGMEVDKFWSSHPYIGFGIPPSVLDERDVGRFPTFLRVELGNVAGE